MMNLTLLDTLSVIVTLVFFSLGSYYDMKAREVSDRMWLIYAPIGVGLTIGRVILDPSTLSLIAISGVITTIVAFGLFYLGLFGGADAKAILCLGATIPLAPNSYHAATWYVHPFFPLVVTITSYLCSISVIVWLGISNLGRYIRRGGDLFSGFSEETWWRKILACFTGYPVNLAKLKSTFYLYPMEEVMETKSGLRRAFKLFVSAEEDRSEEVAKLESQLSGMRNIEEVWVTPGLPHLVFLLFAIIITLMLGDPLFGAVMKLSHTSVN
ncbi:MAG TPA: A24 family peptidase C-terminal domain-containing protein [Methylomirabilota bacterium]|nr:A24 family peptidase C-terminal domain-containing protein [Methylomirabilota bacterium]